MEGRSRFILCAPKWFRNPFQDEFEDTSTGYWTGEIWEQRIERAKRFDRRASADTALLLLVTKHPDLIGQVEVTSYIEYGPKIPEEHT